MNTRYFNFLKIKLKNIGSVFLKGSTAYMIGVFGLIQVAASLLIPLQSLGYERNIYAIFIFRSNFFIPC